MQHDSMRTISTIVTNRFHHWGSKTYIVQWSAVGLTGCVFVQAYSTRASLLNGLRGRQQLARAYLGPVEQQLVYAVCFVYVVGYATAVMHVKLTKLSLYIESLLATFTVYARSRAGAVSERS